ncbi:MAG: hypothetical protein H6Q72_4187 [Firmicutes bacterium]|nr:hypothetical protein [Bacillota bacterium]
MEEIFYMFKYYMNGLFGAVYIAIIAAEAYFKIKYKEESTHFVDVLNWCLLAFLIVVLYGAYHPFNINSIVVSGLCIVQIAKIVREIIMNSISKFIKKDK